MNLKYALALVLVALVTTDIGDCLFRRRRRRCLYSNCSRYLSYYRKYVKLSSKYRTLQSYYGYLINYIRSSGSSLLTTGARNTRLGRNMISYSRRMQHYGDEDVESDLVEDEEIDNDMFEDKLDQLPADHDEPAEEQEDDEMKMADVDKV